MTRQDPSQPGYYGKLDTFSSSFVFDGFPYKIYDITFSMAEMFKIP
jgi:hypothetical protein